jgi:hypothetical protein
MVVRRAERLPVPKSALPEFTPVPRKQPRHDGWTPERQRAFVEFLADTGCVSIACRMVNMSQPSYYMLRRQPGAESFRAAADAAQNLGLQCVKDEAFDRAMNGQLVPVFVAGKLMGFRRKKNDRILMFILRHYGQDAQGRKTTINYFSTKATAGAATASPSPLAGEGDSRSERGEGAGGRAAALAESSTTTVKTVISGPPGQSTTLAREDDDANLINAFTGVDLDAQAQAEIYRALESAAERRRAFQAEPEHDRDRVWIGAAETNGYLGQLESGVEGDWVEYKPDGEHRWESLGEGGEAAEIDRVVGEMQERLASRTPEQIAADEKEHEAEVQRMREQAALPPPGPEPDPDDPRFDWRNWTEGAYQPPSIPPLDFEGRGTAEPAVEGPPPAHPELVEGRTHTPRKRSPEHVPSEACPEPVEVVEGQGRRTYKKRKPKPRFTALDAAAYEARKAKAVKEVEAERRELAAAEAKRRGQRKG